MAKPPRSAPALLLTVLVAVALLHLGSAMAQAPSDEVWLLPIETEITPATAQFVASRVERANEARPQPLALVLLLDTPGGRVTSMESIVETVLNEAQVPTIAVVENAFSAGALIAMSAGSLAMLPGSSIGAALPITIGPGGVTPVGEKLNSALRGQFRAVAEARNRNARVAEAMVDPRIEIPGLASAEELVTLTGEQAVEQGIADLQARTVRDALEQLGYAGVEVRRLEPNLAERIGTVLANPVIAAILLAVGIGGVVLELFVPGFGLPGAIGVLALALFATTALIATPAGPVDVLLILVGLLLIAAEVLLIPGFGVAGVLGLAAIAYASVRVFQQDSLLVLGLTTVVGAGLLGLMFWLLPHERFAAPFKLNTRLLDPAKTADPGRAPLVSTYDDLVGQRGTALSDLRPAGVARLDGRRVDVVTQGDYIRFGSDIEVLRVEGNRVVVRMAEDALEPAPTNRENDLAHRPPTEDPRENPRES